MQDQQNYDYSKDKKENQQLQVLFPANRAES